ncbi:MAG: hypothetical protein KDH20_22695 [Rhodocyclaceae bacterium]|nr:hypothetical protein [Rhodocyclaceae bacterium]
MNTLIRWLVVAGVGWGALAGGYHVWLQQHPHRLLVLLDTSFAMRDVMPRVPALLRGLEGQPYTVYALETDKASVHDYADRLRPGRIDAYAPRRLAELAARAAGAPFDQADEVILVSNAPDSELDALPSRWRILRP